MDRRGFLRGVLAAGMAPAIVRAGSIMPIWVPKDDLIRIPAWDFNGRPTHIILPASFSEIVARTFEKHAPRIRQNIAEHNALLRRLRQ
jgi:hypothetical protein